MGRPDRPAGIRPCEPFGFNLAPAKRTKFLFLGVHRRPQSEEKGPVFRAFSFVGVRLRLWASREIRWRISAHGPTSRRLRPTGGLYAVDRHCDNIVRERRLLCPKIQLGQRKATNPVLTGRADSIVGCQNSARRRVSH